MGGQTRPQRQWRTNGVVQEVKCTSCGAFKPADRKHYYLQRYKGQFVPHSWCKPCYLSNSGRGRGMRTHEGHVPEPDPVVVGAQIGFIAIPFISSAPLVGAVA